MVILSRTSSLKRWPGILQPLQSTFYLDAWEVAPEDITIYEDSVLGKGFFGEVHKGQLSGRTQKRSSIRGMRAPRFSLASVVAIKRLQSKLSILLVVFGYCWFALFHSFCFAIEVHFNLAISLNYIQGLCRNVFLNCLPNRNLSSYWHQ